MQKDYIDPEATFLQNGIRKNEIIYAARELPQGEETADYVDADATKNSVPSNF